MSVHFAIFLQKSTATHSTHHQWLVRTAPWKPYNALPNLYTRRALMKRSLSCFFLAVHESTTTTPHWQTPVIVTSALLFVIVVAVCATLYGLYRRRHPWLVKITMALQVRAIDKSKCVAESLLLQELQRNFVYNFKYEYVIFDKLYSSKDNKM